VLGRVVISSSHIFVKPTTFVFFASD